MTNPLIMQPASLNSHLVLETNVSHYPSRPEGPPPHLPACKIAWYNERVLEYRAYQIKDGHCEHEHVECGPHHLAPEEYDYQERVEDEAEHQHEAAIGADQLQLVAFDRRCQVIFVQRSR